jgi:hypothetical protein
MERSMMVTSGRLSTLTTRVLGVLVLVFLAGCVPVAQAPGNPKAEDADQTVGAQPPASTGPEAKPAPAKAAPAPVTLSADELAEGWVSLFDGQTLFGWQPGSQADWHVEGGAIVVSAGEKGLLYTTSQFSNYVLKLDFRADRGTNSGIFLHTPPKPTDPAADCYELNIAGPDNPFPTGSLVHRQKAEGVSDSTDWQSFEVTVDGAKVLVKLAGRQIVEYTDSQPLQRGHIGLQLNAGRVAFRNIKLKPLGLASIFNGQDLSGWKTYPDMASKFTVTPKGLLHVENGRGQLESQRAYGDFVLQLECITNAPRLNSGVFFRCIPGDVMMGYECQIHNGFKDGNRNHPEDCGTGGLFRRQDARRVVADDLAWFHLTLVADGPHIAAWVNGYQVSDWTDTRPPDVNPRKGLRLEPGTIMIQGHDPTTNISFRNLRIVELSKRSL